ncbi:MAG: hypothetical protein DI603_11505 [Roseateles depolymerans]|uniref:CheR-type methyltransferase domain-containing protein n=1 Tax=Roseateles depolymerans TaxID=76731 RepID=A0A2W5DQP3_9BURK|nr:MAG: hypothetical protein DI603_11505 [Roseateles depolymerans]
MPGKPVRPNGGPEGSGLLKMKNLAVSSHAVTCINAARRTVLVHGQESAGYPLERTAHVPPPYLKRYCLRGFGRHEGTLLVDRTLRDRVQFAQINLMESVPKTNAYDMVFLRNVMIYFNGDTKRQVVARILTALKPGGYLVIGHSENLNGISDDVKLLAPSVYRKPDPAA